MLWGNPYLFGIVDLRDIDGWVGALGVVVFGWIRAVVIV